MIKTAKNKTKRQKPRKILGGYTRDKDLISVLYKDLKTQQKKKKNALKRKTGKGQK